MGGVVRSTISQWRLWRSVKHEDVYLKGYATMGELTLGLAVYFAFYNGERPHQSLGQQTPNNVYRTETGCGAMILVKFKGTPEESPVPLRPTGDSSAEEGKSKDKSRPRQR